jgi:hypothetical protein
MEVFLGTKEKDNTTVSIHEKDRRKPWQYSENRVSVKRTADNDSFRDRVQPLRQTILFGFLQ